MPVASACEGSIASMSKEMWKGADLWLLGIREVGGSRYSRAWRIT